MSEASKETEKLSRDWELLALTDHYHTAVAIRDALREGDVADATQGLEELIDALSRSEQRALESYLMRLMQHIIKWHVQPERRTPSWIMTIRNCRRQIARLQKRYPRFTDRFIQEQAWTDCLEDAHGEAAAEMNRLEVPWMALSWQDVFETDYRLEP